MVVMFKILDGGGDNVGDAGEHGVGTDDIVVDDRDVGESGDDRVDNGARGYLDDDVGDDADDCHMDVVDVNGAVDGVCSMALMLMMLTLVLMI